jgi:hypothetical protein
MNPTVMRSPLPPCVHATLAFYAYPENWKDGRAQQDGGEQARKALKDLCKHCRKERTT